MKHLIFGLLVLVAQCAAAQHCPFDGSTILLIQLDFENESFRNHFQMELVVPPYDSSVAGCQDFALPMDLKKGYVSSTPDTSFVNDLYERFSTKYDLTPNHYAFFLSHSHLACYKNDKIFQRDFRLKVSLTDLKSKVYEFAIKPKQIYSLCIGAGNWRRVQAVHLKVKKNGVFILVKK